MDRAPGPVRINQGCLIKFPADDHLSQRITPDQVPRGARQVRIEADVHGVPARREADMRQPRREGRYPSLKLEAAWLVQGAKGSNIAAQWVAEDDRHARLRMPNRGQDRNLQFQFAVELHRSRRNLVVDPDALDRDFRCGAYVAEELQVSCRVDIRVQVSIDGLRSAPAEGDAAAH